MKKRGLIFASIFLTSFSYGQFTDKDTAHSKFNEVLMLELDTIGMNDQGYREALQNMVISGIKDTAKLLPLVRIVHKQDSVNQIKVKYIISKYGWLGPDEVGEDGSQALFLVIQHAGLAMQESYLPLMKDAVKNGKASGRESAFLEDKVLLGEGKKQIYGTQVEVDSTGAKHISPLEDPDNVDKRRAEVGLQPMAVYCKYFHTKWDLEEYKKGLPLAIDKDSL